MRNVCFFELMEFSRTAIVTVHNNNFFLEYAQKFKNHINTYQLLLLWMLLHLLNNCYWSNDCTVVNIT